LALCVLFTSIVETPQKGIGQNARPRRFRNIGWLALVLALALFACHVSTRLVDASQNYNCFNTDERQATFSDLFIYAAHLPWYNCDGDSCINKLRQIDGAKQEWAFETKAAASATPTWKEIQPFLGRRSTGNLPLPRCPQGGLYTINSISNMPTCTVKGHVLE
jgi:hypothetical protein